MRILDELVRLLDFAVAVEGLGPDGPSVHIPGARWAQSGDDVGGEPILSTLGDLTRHTACRGDVTALMEDQMDQLDRVGVPRRDVGW